MMEHVWMCWKFTCFHIISLVWAITCVQVTRKRMLYLNYRTILILIWKNVLFCILKDIRLGIFTALSVHFACSCWYRERSFRKMEYGVCSIDDYILRSTIIFAHKFARDNITEQSKVQSTARTVPKEFPLIQEKYSTKNVNITLKWIGWLASWYLHFKLYNRKGLFTIQCHVRLYIMGVCLTRARPKVSWSNHYASCFHQRTWQHQPFIMSQVHMEGIKEN